MSTKPRVAVVQAAPVAFELDATLAAYWEAAIDIPGSERLVWGFRSHGDEGS